MRRGIEKCEKSLQNKGQSHKDHRTKHKEHIEEQQKRRVKRENWWKRHCVLAVKVIYPIKQGKNAYFPSFYEPKHNKKSVLTHSLKFVF